MTRHDDRHPGDPRGYTHGDTREDTLREIEERTRGAPRGTHPHFARALRMERPLGPRDRRRAGRWLAALAATALVVLGLTLPNSVCFGAGLILAGLTAALRGHRPHGHRPHDEDGR